MRMRGAVKRGCREDAVESLSDKEEGRVEESGEE